MGVGLKAIVVLTGGNGAFFRTRSPLPLRSPVKLSLLIGICFLAVQPLRWGFYAEISGHREMFVPLAEELKRQCGRFQAILAGGENTEHALDTSVLDWAAHIMEDRTDDGRSAE